MSENNNEELHWLAFQYVDGTLSMDEREAFERRLADDQEAREAVASAVELGQTVSAAFTRPARAPAARYRSSRTAVHWVAVLSAGGLLGLLFAIGLGLNPSGAERAPQTRTASEADASDAELAMVWGELLHVEEPAPNSADHEPLAELTEEDLDAQDWMVAALASMALEEASKE